MSQSKCGGCGAAFDAHDGPVHAYVVSSPECWSVFSELLITNQDRLYTDAYMAQHADGDDPRQIQSVNVHVMTLHAVFGRGQSLENASKITSAGVTYGRQIGGYPKLSRPPVWPHTVADISTGGITTSEYVTSVYETWMDWDPETPEKWAQGVLELIYG